MSILGGVVESEDLRVRFNGEGNLFYLISILVETA
jgi:hypothetical protein